MKGFVVGCDGHLYLGAMLTRRRLLQGEKLMSACAKLSCGDEDEDEEKKWRMKKDDGRRLSIYGDISIAHLPHLLMRRTLLLQE